MGLPLVKIRLRGEEGTAARYVGLLRSWAIRLDKQRQELKLPALLRRWRFGTTVEAIVHVSDVGLFVDIFASGGACSMWMDSGVVDLGGGAFSEMHADAMNGAPIYIDGLGTTMRGSIKASGGVFVGSDAPVDGAITPAFDIPTVDGVRTPDGALPRKKIFAAEVPASHFSGRMRLFVQALYGRKFKPADVERYQEAGVEPTLLLRKPGDAVSYYTLSNNAASSNGLYFDSQFRPWFVCIYQSGTYRVQIRQASLSDCGNSVRRHLASTSYTGLELERLIAVMLSETWVNFDGHNMTFDTGISVGTGGPLAYGWAFKRDGSNAEIVTHIQTSVAGVWRSRATRLRITINRNVGVEAPSEQARWAVTGSVVSTNQDWNVRFGGEFIWRPNYIRSQLELTQHFDPLTTQLTYFPETVVHVYYDNSDTLVEVKLTNSATEGTTSGTTSGCYSQVDPEVDESDTYTEHQSGAASFDIRIGSQLHQVLRGNYRVYNWFNIGDVFDRPEPPHPPTNNPSNKPAGFDDPVILYSISEESLAQYPSSAPCQNPQQRGVNDAYDAARAAYDLTYGSPCSTSGTHYNNDGVIIKPYYWPENVRAENGSDNELTSRGGAAALVFPIHDSAACYVFYNQSRSGTVRAVRGETNYRGRHYYRFAYFGAAPPPDCVVTSWSEYYVRLGTSSPGEGVIASDVTTAVNEYAEFGVGHIGGGAPLDLPPEVLDGNKTNLLGPSFSNPYHNNTFPTRSASVASAGFGEGIQTGGYSATLNDKSRFQLAFVGYA